MVPKKFRSRTNFDPKKFELHKNFGSKNFRLGWVRLSSSSLGQVSQLGRSCWSSWPGWVDLEGLVGAIWVRYVGFQTLSRHFHIPTRHLPDTFLTPSRHHPDTIKTQSRHQSSSCVKLSSHTKFQLSKSCRSPKQIYMVGFRGGAAAGGKKICLII